MTEQNDNPPFEASDGRFSVTLKGGKGYDAPWVVIYGDTSADVKSKVATFFGITTTEDMTAAQVVFNATQQWLAMNNAAEAMPGARAVSRGSGNRSAAYAAAAEPVDPKAVLIAKIEAQVEVEDLKRLYAEDPDAFKDEEVLAAYKTKGKALSTK